MGRNLRRVLLGALLGVAMGATWAALASARAPAAFGSDKRAAEPPAPVLVDPPSITRLENYRSEYLPAPVFGGRVYVVEAGPSYAPAVVLIHGLGDSASAWYDALPALAARYRVLTFDLPGFGRSSPSDEPYSPETYAAFVQALVSERVPGHFHLVGHSMGAAIAIEVAARMPDSVDRLMLVDSAGILEPKALIKDLSETALHRKYGDGSSFGRWMRETLRGAIQDVPNWADRLARYLLLNGSQDDSNRRAASGLLTHDIGPALDAVRAPTLVVWGENDRVAPPRTAWVLSSRISGAQIKLMPGVGHVPMEDVGAFTSLTLAWLDGTWSARAPVHEGSPDRDGRCLRQNRQVFEGQYREIRIESCRNVTLRNVRASRLVIKGSVVDAEDLVVHGEGVAISVVGSELTVSGGYVSGDVALQARGSDLDLAGVTFQGERAAIEVPRGTNLICSVCRLQSLQGNRRLHEARSLASGSVL